MVTIQPRPRRHPRTTICTVIVAAITVAVPCSAAAADGHKHASRQAECGACPTPIQRALDLLRWLPDETPRIVVIDNRPPSVNANAEAWVVRDDAGIPARTIYVAGWSPLYRSALANGLYVRYALIRLAAVLAHERTHIDKGPDEEEAYIVQLRTLIVLNAALEDQTKVSLSLQAIKRQQRSRR